MEKTDGRSEIVIRIPFGYALRTAFLAMKEMVKETQKQEGTNGEGLST